MLCVDVCYSNVGLLISFSSFSFGSLSDLEEIMILGGYSPSLNKWQHSWYMYNNQHVV